MCIQQSTARGLSICAGCSHTLCSHRNFIVRTHRDWCYILHFDEELGSVSQNDPEIWWLEITFRIVKLEQPRVFSLDHADCAERDHYGLKSVLRPSPLEPGGVG
ncbi:hypothetical protein SAMN05216251_12727 [Actinacidiphila alni]|uniref:Uncharacterized protein n=1 Tax=Actinacidiphila alni TaxID=380248 RepID=A0A1I2L8I6_9ACTN|nr:hypothetical protein SAMN05216251_12727 [Actinacidiphila alni]